MKILVLGITGHPSSGKDTVANHAATLGFSHISTSDLIREEMAPLGIPTDRAHVSAFARDSRKERGPGYLAEISVMRVLKIGESGRSENCIVSGLRNTAEIDVLKKAFGKNFTLIAVEAPLKTRYGWAQARKRIGDEISFEQFKTQEDAERKGNVNAQHVDDVIAAADILILNDGTKEELLKKVEEIVASK